MLKIMLGDLRHRTLGRHSTFMPLGIGFIASYCKSQLGGAVEIKMYDDPDVLLREIDSWKPHVIGLSNYMWNAEVNNLVFNDAKSISREILCVAGGPEFPTDLNECAQYLRDRPSIDFFAQLEGEIVFTELVQKIIKGVTVEELKGTPQVGLFSLHPATKELVYSASASRIADLNIIPSPYLTGIMDGWFDGDYMPAVQTSRGCPYVCSYCRAGNRVYSKINHFNLDRVKEELAFIAEKIHGFKSNALLLMDSNFGLFERDEEIAGHIRWLQDKYDWPHSILADTSRKNYDRVFQMSKKMQNRMSPLSSLQTTNPDTLKVISRNNIPFPRYKAIQKELASNGIKPGTELILPLPLETKASFINAIRDIFNSGVENITVFTWMLLPGTELANQESRFKYKLKSGFRLVPRQFGEYKGELCFEVEEVCYSTSTLSFDEYIECRGFSFLCFLFARIQYDFVKKHMVDLSIDFCDFIEKVLVKLKTSETDFAQLYRQLVAETKSEILPTRKALYKKYSNPENYKRLLKGEIGDNLFRKYLSRVFLDSFPSSVELIYETLVEMIVDKPRYKENIIFLESAKEWVLAIRDFSGLFKNINAIDATVHLEFPFDFHEWYSANHNKFDPAEFIAHKKIKLHYLNKSLVKDIITQGEKLYGTDKYYSLGKILVHYSPDSLWKHQEED